MSPGDLESLGSGNMRAKQLEQGTPGLHRGVKYELGTAGPEVPKSLLLLALLPTLSPPLLLHHGFLTDVSKGFPGCHFNS